MTTNLPETNPTESQQIPTEFPGIPLTVEVVITFDHVYLPLDAENNAVADWAVTNVSMTKVSRDTVLHVPDDLAAHLKKRCQADFV
jgi:hypothetical protein